MRRRRRRMEFIKQVSQAFGFAMGQLSQATRKLRRLVVCALLAAAAGPAHVHLPCRAPAAPAGQAAALRDEAAVRRLKADGGYATIVAAMAAARYQINADPAQSDRPALFYANN